MIETNWKLFDKGKQFVIDFQLNFIDFVTANKFAEFLRLLSFQIV